MSAVSSNGAKLCFYLKSNGTTETLVASSEELLPGVWTHVAGTWDGSTMKLYQDGVLVASKAKDGILDTNGDALVAIGNLPPDTDNQPFDGKIDDMRIYNFALSQAEIEDLIYNCEAVTCTECDFYHDGWVNGSDLWIWMEHWLQ